MSDTDDTDILLLIPPNFFYEHNSGDSEDSLLQSSRTVVHKPKSCTSQVIGKLVSQVHCLKNRLECLELTTATDTSRDALFGNNTYDYSISFDSYSLDRKSFTFPRAQKRKVSKRRKRRDVSITSLESNNASEKVVSPFNFEERLVAINDFQSMDEDVSSIVSTPNKRNDKLFLHEIDEFLHKVESYESPDSQYKVTEPALSPQQVIRATGDYFTQKIFSNDVSSVSKLNEKQAENAILDKYIYLMQNPSKDEVSENGKNEPGNSKFNDITPKPSSSHLVAQNKQSPAYRKLQYPENNKDVQTTSTPKKYIIPPNASSRNTPNYNSKFCPTTNKVHDGASKVLNQYKGSISKNDDTVNTNLLLKDEGKQQSRLYDGRFKLKEVCKGTQKYVDTIDSDLLSLSDLWGGGKGDQMESRKLEEERLKREHCEAMIQELQKKLLEQQERVAVAMKVDRAKDAAINKLKDAWHHITEVLEKNEEKHNAAINKMGTEVQQFRQMACDFQKKAEHYEGELYKTLDLAHDYQEKCKLLTKDKQDCETKINLLLSNKDEIIKQKESEIKDLRDQYETVIRLNKQTGECIRSLESALEKEQLEHNMTRTKILDINKKTESITEETTLLAQERDILKDKTNEERAKNQMLEKQLTDTHQMLKARQKREEALENEVLELRKHLEVQKNDLKVHYQRQLEEAVLCKLQEFQSQLEQAERDMEMDGRAKEMALLDNCNKQISRVQEQHKLEISVLEEKHKEEVKLYRLQIAQATERASLLETKVETYRRRRSQLASQLHGVMEAQWRQALSILTTPTADVTHASTPIPQEYGTSTAVPPLTMPASESSFKLTEEKLTDKLLNLDMLSDSELQNYVKTLLTKPVSLDTSDKLLSLPDCDTNEQPTSDRPRPKHGKGHKPPWKS